MLSRIIKVIILLVMLAGLAYAGLCVYSCATHQQGAGMPDIPEVAEAAYTLTIENTGKLIMTNDVEVMGSVVGSRVFILHGRWEFMGQDFKYKSEDVVLDEAIFGEITLRRR